MTKHKLIFFGFLLLLLNYVWGLDNKYKIDSLRKCIRNTNDDTVKINLLFQFAQMQEDIYPDSSILLFNAAINTIDRCKNEEGLEGNLIEKKGKAFFNIGRLNFNLGNYQNAIYSCQKAIDCFNVLNNLENVARCYHSIGEACRLLGSYNDAIINFEKSIQIKRELRDSLGCAITYSSAAKCYLYFGKIKIAKEYLQRAINITESVKDTVRNARYNLFLGQVYYDIAQYDSALFYLSKSYTIRKEISDMNGLTEVMMQMGDIYLKRGQLETAKRVYDNAIEFLKNHEDNESLSNAYNSIGLLYMNCGHYPKALSYLILADSINILMSDIDKTLATKVNIGQIYVHQKEYESAVKLFLSALSEAERLGGKNYIATILGNLGCTHIEMTQYEKALDYLLRANDIFMEIESQQGVASCLDNIGICFLNLNKLKDAIKYHRKANKMYHTIGDTIGLTGSYNNLAQAYLDMVKERHANKKNCMDSSYYFAQQALSMAYKTRSFLSQNIAANTLMKISVKQSNYQNAYKYAEIYISTRDSMFSEEKTKAIAEMTTKYETEKKQLEIDNLNKENELHQSEILRQNEVTKRQKTTIFYSILCLVLIACFALFVIHRLRITKRQKLVIEEQNGVLIQQKEEIIAQRDEIEAQRDMVVEQKNFIENQKKEIDDSIEYAKRIQTALLPSNVLVNKMLGEHFILFKPRNTVSGDFYWVTQINDCLVVAVADCTGHGVPGAFMSMLGISFLNEIVLKKETISPNVILSELRTAIIDSLGQTNTIGAQKDGMDISLATINKNTKECVWAGANNPLLVLRKQNSSNPVIEEYKPDKMPISVHIKMTDFTNNAINLDSGDRIYLFSDGYSDQFGGIDGKKFKYSKFKELICNTVALPIEEQGQRIELEIKQWMHQNGNTFDQTDDITVLGICIA